MNGRIIIKSLLIVTCLLLITLSKSLLFSQETQQLQQRYLNILKLVNEEKQDQAIQSFQQLIAENPEFGKAYGKIAQAYISKKDTVGAQVYFDKLLSENSNNPYAYYGLAQINLEKEEYDQAIENLKKCIKLDPTFTEAYHLSVGLPAAYAAQNHLDSSIQFFNELIQAGSRNPFAFYGLAGTYVRKNDFDQALIWVDKAIELSPELLSAYSLKSYCLFYTSRFPEVIENSEILLKIAERSYDGRHTASALNYLGISYSSQKDYWKALQFLSKSLKIAREIYDTITEGHVILNLAVVYAGSGNFSQALAYSQAALEIARKTGDKFLETTLLLNIGNLNKDQGNVQEGLKYFEKALLLARKIGLKSSESLTLLNIAAVFELLYEYDRALEYQYEALEIAREIRRKSTEGWALFGLGITYRKLGRYETAGNYLRQSLKIGTELQDARLIWTALTDLGSNFKHQENKQRAIHYYSRAIALYDSIRTDLRIESLASTFLENKYQAYPSIVELVAECGKYSEAFTYTEKCKAKVLLDILAKGQVKLEGLLPDSLRSRLAEIQSQIEVAHDTLSVEYSKAKKNKEKILSLDQKITDLEIQKVALIEQVKKDYAAFYNLTTSEPLSIGEIQSRILGPEQTLVEYLVGPEKLSVFVVTSDTLIYHSVDISQDSLRQMLADLSPLFQPKKGIDEQTGEQILSPQLADFSIHPAHSLYEILVKPIESWLSDTEELIIVPDDILFYLPFEMLVIDTSGVETSYDFANCKFLLEKYVISYASSASLLNPDLQRERKPQQDILALGNPAFGPRDEIETTDLLAVNLRYSGGIVRGGKLVSLPHSEIEVKAIDKVFDRARNNISIGDDATEQSFKNRAEEYRILHLATHFLTNDANPLYSKIILAQQNETDEDGYLQAYEIFNLNLNADMAVLSACNTGLGKLRKGEGLMGISRAFLYAGVPSLVVTLWSIDDESSSMIMKNFYQHLKVGLNKKQALRQAKIDYLKSSTNTGKDPFYWAPFILIGDWSPIHLPERTYPNWIIVFIFIVLITTIVFLVSLYKLRSVRYRDRKGTEIFNNGSSKN